MNSFFRDAMLKLVQRKKTSIILLKMEDHNKHIEDININVENIFKQKNPTLAKLIPRFIYNYIKRVIHEKEINILLPKISGYQGLEYVKAGLDELNVHSRVIGKKNIPVSGRFIFVANHPLGGLDGLVFAKEIGEIFPNIHFPVNDILLNLKNFGPIFIPINKHGKQTAEYARKMEEAYSSDAQILYFPAGLCSRRSKGTIRDLEWKKHFIAKAIQHKRDIIPVYIEGRNSNFFYRLANIRKLLGIKSNIEMFYLPDEMFKQKNKTITLIVGKPVSYTFFDKSKQHTEWAELVKALVYSLNQKEASL